MSSPSIIGGRTADELDLLSISSVASAAVSNQMRMTPVGVAWDRHILTPGTNGFVPLTAGRTLGWPRVTGTEEMVARYADYEFHTDLLSHLGAMLTLNFRIGEQVILMLCGPYSEDYANYSGPVGVHWSAGLSNSDRTWQYLLLMEGPGLTATQLGDAPAGLARLEGGREVCQAILTGWAHDIFELIAVDGIAAFCRLGVGLDPMLQQDWLGAADWIANS